MLVCFDLFGYISVSQAHIIYVSNEDEYCKPGSVPADSASVDSAKEILQSINMNSSLSFGKYLYLQQFQIE